MTALKRRIPPHVFRYWARMFAQGDLDKEYGEEIAELLDWVANDEELHLALSTQCADWHKGPMQ